MDNHDDHHQIDIITFTDWFNKLHSPFLHTISMQIILEKIYSTPFLIFAFYFSELTTISTTLFFGNHCLIKV